MYVMIQFATLLCICLLSEVISSLLPFAFPASIIGMFILLALLLLKIFPEKQIDRVSTFLLGNMSFFFIPAAIGILDIYGDIKPYILTIILICVITFIIAFAVCSLTAAIALKIMGSHSKNGGGRDVL